MITLCRQYFFLVKTLSDCSDAKKNSCEKFYVYCNLCFQGTFVHIVPPIVLFLAKHELVPKFDLSSVHTFFTAAAPVGQEMMNAVTERLNNPALKFRQG